MSLGKSNLKKKNEDLSEKLDLLKNCTRQEVYKLIYLQLDATTFA